MFVYVILMLIVEYFCLVLYEWETIWDRSLKILAFISYVAVNTDLHSRRPFNIVLDQLKLNQHFNHNSSYLI